MARGFLVTLALLAAVRASADVPPPPDSYESPQLEPGPPLDQERPPPGPPPVSREFDGDTSRVVLMPTAWRLRTGQQILNTYQLGSFELERAVGERWQVSIQTAVPVGLVGLGAMVRTGFEGRHYAMGVQVQALASWFFVDDAEWALLVGAGGVLTVGNRDHYLNLGVMFHGVFFKRSGGWTNFGVLTPHLGASIRLGEHGRLLLEAWLPARTDSGRRFGELLVVLYGTRIFGPRFWMDLGFFRHICRGCSETYRKLPPGYPYISVGRPF